MTASEICAPLGSFQSNGTLTRAHCKRWPHAFHARCGSAAEAFDFAPDEHAALLTTAHRAAAAITLRSSRNDRRFTIALSALGNAANDEFSRRCVEKLVLRLRP